MGDDDSPLLAKNGVRIALRRFVLAVKTFLLEGKLFSPLLCKNEVRFALRRFFYVVESRRKSEDFGSEVLFLCYYCRRILCLLPTHCQSQSPLRSFFMLQLYTYLTFSQFAVGSNQRF